MKSSIRNITFYSTLDKEINLKNSRAELAIKRTKQANANTFTCQGLVVSFNGGSEIKESDPLFKQSLEVAEEIVSKGGIVLNGGRPNGIMESTGRGAGEYCLGVLFPQLQDRQHKYGQKIIVSSPETRLQILTEFPPYVIVYPGGIGTVQELINAVTIQKHSQIFGYPYSPTILMEKSWFRLINYLIKANYLKPEYAQKIIYFSSVDEILDNIIK
ncbi:LOG family protein [Patescibacteria group bacterium]|nr:LOG family protein [Patescibacteria group bacterium]MBU0963612.1 LOG family protein [Patescibacteria group bacterium]